MHLLGSQMYQTLHIRRIYFIWFPVQNSSYTRVSELSNSRLHSLPWDTVWRPDKHYLIQVNSAEKLTSNHVEDSMFFVKRGVKVLFTEKGRFIKIYIFGDDSFILKCTFYYFGTDQNTAVIWRIVESRFFVGRKFHNICTV
jgi:hypothetical protein